MRAFGKTSGALIAAAAMLVASSAIAQADSSGVDGADLVKGPGYVIVGPHGSDAAATTHGDFYPTGDIDPDTLIVVRNDDGSLPGGISIAQLEQLLEAQAKGDYAAIEKAGFAVPRTESQ
ncbi:hypothetical protein SAMN05216410_0424 [Sanguibacter gelidistatuariae]|uniref:Uncharacterized protein n=1 Tax=Sanguibacter gelidistatuariae TaxID=1814289 RepID=A0A1G6GS81_9MICO|nr:hypothetical protein [Sanguibacter gelidistatuariae]SDB84847.1 hypothetical protein SAMN05216410_0424 [Sanguibacter gelidistatuariae]